MVDRRGRKGRRESGKRAVGGKHTRSVQILVVVWNKIVHVKVKGDNLAPELFDLAGGEFETTHVAEVLANRPQGRVGQRRMPRDQLLGCGHVLGDGLLAQNVFPCRERLLDDLRLGQDRQADHDGANIRSGQ